MSRAIVGLNARVHQRGMTLIELMVALTISLIVVLAAVASLTVARRGFSTVDAASQLRDNARFAADLIQRIGLQTGYRDFYSTMQRCDANIKGCVQNPDSDSSFLETPGIFGEDNKKPSSTDPVNDSVSHAAGAVGAGSDKLVIRYQVSRTYDDPTSLQDGSVIDCHGNAATTPIFGDRAYSVLYVGPGVSGEPALLCYRQGSSTPISQPLVDGVEMFQVLYGVAGVTPNTAPIPWTTDAIPYVPERYLNASQMTVPGNTRATAANWRRVRSIRIGMVLRGPPNSAQTRGAQTLYPFGLAKGSAGGSEGSAYSSASDIGTIFVAPDDGRLRQVVSFTIHLRNFQEQ